MEQSLLGLLTLPFLVFCVITMLITKGFRLAVEGLAKKVAKIFPDKYEPWWQWLWREIILPGAPAVIGGLMAYFIVDYPYPDQFGQSDASRVFVGVISGIIGAWIFPRFMFYYRKFAPKKADEEAKKLEDLQNTDAE